MIGRSTLAVAICMACFFMGYLFYVAVTMIAGFFISETDTCQNTVAVCSQQNLGR